MEKTMKPQKPKVLIVDDDQLVRQIVQEILSDENYEIQLAKDGKDALESIHRDQPDIIILDIMMPIMDGLDVSKHLKSNRTTASIPIIMLTARTSISDKFDGFDAGADEYISKPFDADVLQKRVKSLLRRTQMDK